MTQNVTDRMLLLDGILEYMDKQLLPSLSGEHRFVTRVAVNALGMIRRELRAQSVPDPELTAARERLRQAMADASTSAASATGATANADADADADAFDRTLADRIRRGAVGCDDPLLRDYVRASLRHSLQINNPKWLSGAKNRG